MYNLLVEHLNNWIHLSEDPDNAPFQPSINRFVSAPPQGPQDPLVLPHNSPALYRGIFPGIITGGTYGPGDGYTYSGTMYICAGGGQLFQSGNLI
jgi:hypothetical protein